MKQLSTALLTAALFTASTLCAELKYISYDLANPAADPIAVPVANIKAAEYHTGSTMLFVQDTEISEEYYIGAFEVTVAQARALGWTTTEASGEAYATSKSWAHTIPATLPRLTFPAVAQWQAYAGKPVQPCNVYQGANSIFGPFALSKWYTDYLSTGKVTANTRGVFDIFGNVAEYAADTGKFYGGFADASCKIADLTAESGVAASAVPTNGINSQLLGARLIYTPPEAQKYEVITQLQIRYTDTETVTEELSREAYTVDTAVKIPVCPANYDLVERTVTAPDGFSLDPDATGFTMPAGIVTVTYAVKPYLTIQVQGGTVVSGTQTTPVTGLKAYPGDTLTFTALPPSGTLQRFEAWTLPDNTAKDTESFSVTIERSSFSASTPSGTTLTYTAAYTEIKPANCARVLVYSGTVTLDSGESYGEGYYTPGAKLTLTAPDIDGYTFEAWQQDGADTSSDETFTHTAGAAGTTVIFTPRYTLSTASGELSVTKIGEADASADTARVEVGYLAGTTSGYTLGEEKNPFTYYATTENKATFLELDTVSQTINYDEDENFPSSLTAIPTLKRVAPEEGQPYYVGLHETTRAHTQILAILAEIKRLAAEEETDSVKERLAVLKEQQEAFFKSVSTEDADDTPHVCTATETNPHGSYFDNIKTVFGITAALPTVEQIAGISEDYKTGPQPNNPVEVSKIKAETIFSGGNGRDALDYKATELARCDYYGFYDILGNVLDMFADGTLRGGNCAIAAGLCKIDDSQGTFPSAFPGAFRPVVAVRKKLEVTIEGLTDQNGKELSDPLTVLPDQVINLAPQVKSGTVFAGWQATVNGATTPIDEVNGSYPYTVTTDVTLTPIFSDGKLTLSCENCCGPESAVPGGTVRIYAETPGKPLQNLTVTPAEAAAAINVAAGTVTFAAEATGTVTVTATYDVPEPAKPGYRFGLR